MSLTTQQGRNAVSRALGGDILPTNTAARRPFGTSTAVDAASLTDSGKTWVVDEWIGRMVFTGTVYGVVKSNTTTVLTFDKWYDPGDPGGAAATTPGTGTYVIGGQAPFRWMGLTTSTGLTPATDTTLPGELTTSGLSRALASYAHTTLTDTFSLTYTYVSGDVTTRTVHALGIFDAASGGNLIWETVLDDDAIVQIGDTVVVTETVDFVP